MADVKFSYDLNNLLRWEAAVGLIFAAILLPAFARYAKVLTQRRTLPPGPFPLPFVRRFGASIPS